jgi:putative nucleotidyltransferase with HDIG domain
MERLSITGRVYVLVIALLGAATLVHSAIQLYLDPLGWNWVLLAVLTLLSGSATVKLPSVPATISVSETFVFTSALLFGPAAGTITVALDALVISLWLARRGHPLHRIAFNIFALPAAMWVGAHAYYAIGDVPPLYTLDTSADPVKISRLLIPLVCFTTIYFGLNSSLIALAISLEKRMSPLRVWRDNFAWLSLNYFGGASVAALLVTYTRNIDYAYIAFVLPLLAVLYFTFSVSMGRVEDANQHLGQLNKLYMSTIETLAMAIDAKDQITHGHIRRVQQYAVGLARHMGVTDPEQISAIEAASLLHDMGKLAVPEYILNKPGKLTPAEFEKMKLHASVGADILSAIEFPYPVVPIVRHHHENWDGTGYPDRVRGSDIPIGARILSVVDCFDALTSDRPYRPRLSNSDAIRILLERRGSMYDPLVVDAFIRVHSDLAVEPLDVPAAAGGLSAITRVTSPSVDSEAADSRLNEISASTEEMLALYQLAQGLTAHLDVADAAELIAKHLRRVVPASTTVFYIHDTLADELYVAHAAGDGASHFAGLRIPRGQRLSGWVAANHQSILNSDPVLDLGDAARSLRPPLRSCLSAPLLIGETLIGVLTVYSPHRQAFSEDHRRILEVIGGQVSHTLRRAVTFQRERFLIDRDSQSGLPNARQLERIVTNELALGETSVPLSLLVVRVTSDEARSLRHGSEDVLRLVAEASRPALRGADLVFHFAANELAILLLRTDDEASKRVVKRVARRLSTDPRMPQDVSISMGLASTPSDGSSLADLLNMAGQRGRTIADYISASSSIH